MLPGVDKFFSCVGVNRDTLESTIQAIHQAIRQGVRWASQASNEWEGEGYWEYDGMTCQMSVTDRIERWVEPGAEGELPVLHVTVYRTASCDWVSTYRWVPPPGSTPAGPGSGPGSGPGEETAPTTGTPTVPAVPDIADSISQFEPDPIDSDTLWGCSPLPSHPGHLAWCIGRDPEPLAIDRIRAAIERMRARGGECVPLAFALDTVLARGNLKLYTASKNDIAGWGEMNYAGGTRIVLADIFTGVHYDKAHKGMRAGVEMTLQFMLAHEIDHAFMEEHEDGDRGLLTRHAIMCSDVNTQTPPPVPQ